MVERYEGIEDDNTVDKMESKTRGILRAGQSVGASHNKDRTRDVVGFTAPHQVLQRVTSHWPRRLLRITRPVKESGRVTRPETLAEWGARLLKARERIKYRYRGATRLQGPRNDASHAWKKKCVSEGYSSSYLVRYGGYAASRNYGEEVTPTSTPEHHGPHTSADDAPAACKHRTKQPPNMWTTMLVWTAAVVLLPAPRAVNAYGVFELRLKSFVNEYGKDSLGKCCSGSASKTGECSGVCKTKFRVCLKEYQVKIDTTTECTYGDVVTPVLGENIVNFSPNVAMPSFTNPIRFPFNFRWPDILIRLRSSTVNERECHQVQTPSLHKATHPRGGASVRSLTRAIIVHRVYANVCSPSLVYVSSLVAVRVLLPMRRTAGPLADG
ncbi:Neurogenic locus protein delta [Eufriesea mexicana]|uniref:Neurogenic locus protein delta n=1 Tax=Eufriesea mexicana TaxID=516756 RepID=A0A310S849_9HYME|nr:Neurogenic locus protein delta [Eufriesea mexicana]